MGALIIGIAAGLVCFWGVSGLKRLLGADGTLDVFGVHGLGGILGALLTGVFNTQELSGPGLVTDWVTVTVGSNPIPTQVLIQAKAVGVTIVWFRDRRLHRLQSGRSDRRTARQRRSGARRSRHDRTQRGAPTRD
jgi:ammonia channel protein AmtB